MTIHQIITINSTSLFHAPGLFRYARRAWASGDAETAIAHMTALTNEQVNRAGVIAILRGATSFVVGADTVELQVPHEHIKEHTHEPE